MSLARALVEYHKPVDIDAGPMRNGTPSVEGRCVLIAQEFALSPRELDVLHELARGHSSSYIASSFCISSNTARTHMRNIYKKLGVSSREELLARIWEK